MSQEQAKVRQDDVDPSFTLAVERFLAMLSPALAPFATTLVEAGIKDADAFHRFITLEDDGMCLMADRIELPIFPRQLLRAGLQGLRASGWDVGSLRHS